MSRMSPRPRSAQPLALFDQPRGIVLPGPGQRSASVSNCPQPSLNGTHITIARMIAMLIDHPPGIPLRTAPPTPATARVRVVPSDVLVAAGHVLPDEQAQLDRNE